MRAQRLARRNLVRYCVGRTHPWAPEVYMWGDEYSRADFLHYCVAAVLNIVSRAPWQVPRPERLARDICETAWALRYIRRSNYARAMSQLHRDDLPS